MDTLIILSQWLLPVKKWHQRGDIAKEEEEKVFLYLPSLEIVTRSPFPTPTPSHAAPTPSHAVSLVLHPAESHRF